jgi:hypothetical protein
MASKRTKDEGPVARLRAAHVAGDYRAARTMARKILRDPGAPEPDQAEARALLARTAPDPRALGIAIAALGLAALVIVVFLLG